MIPARFVMAAVLLVFCWKGAALNVRWPQPPAVAVQVPKPSAEQLAWADDLKPILPKMLAKDREYLSSFYDAMRFVLGQDAGRQPPIISDTDKFIAFHAGSLTLAIEKENVGKYPKLDDAIDSVFFAACGADPASIGDAQRQKLMDACGVLAYVFKVHGE
jgi:hypothetical protein